MRSLRDILLSNSKDALYKFHAKGPIWVKRMQLLRKIKKRTNSDFRKEYFIDKNIIFCSFRKKNY